MTSLLTRNPLGRETRIPANVVQASGRIVRVTHEIQIRLVRARDAIRPQGEDFRVRSYEPASRAHSRRKTRGEDDVVERLFHPAHEAHTGFGELGDPRPHRNATSTNRVHEVKANEWDGIERTVSRLRQHRLAATQFCQFAYNVGDPPTRVLRQAPHCEYEILNRHS